MTYPISLVRALAIMLACAAFAHLSRSQTPLPTTVGHVLRKGGLVINGKELSELLIGNTWRSTYGTSGELTFRSDRSFVGTLVVSDIYTFTGATGVFGEWEINSAGQLCVTWKHRGGRLYPQFCRSWYRLEGKYFAGGPPEKKSWEVWLQEKIN